MKLRIYRIAIGFLLGVLLTVLVFYFIGNSKEEKQNTDYYLLTNQISKMNKLVVLEQDFSRIQKTKITSQLLGLKALPVAEKEMVIFTKTKAQVSYDLQKMKIEVDSAEKKLLIRSLPTAEIRIFTDAEITALDDSFWNRFSEDDFKRITARAKKEAEQSVNKNKLRTQGRRQLIENLNEIFVLAKALNYKIVDETQTLSFPLP